MFTMVMMTALAGSPDAVQFGGRSKGCDGGSKGFLGGLFNRGGRGMAHSDACCGPVAPTCCGSSVAVPAVPSCCGSGGAVAAPSVYHGQGTIPLTTTPTPAPTSMPGTAPPATTTPPAPMPDKPATPDKPITTPPVTPGTGF